MENFLNDYLNSELSLIEFCKLNNLNRDQFNQYLNSLGYYYRPRRSGIMVNLYKLAIDEYLKDNYSPSVIAKKYNLNAQSLTTELKTLNLYDPNKKGLHKKNYNEHIFDKIDTEEKAYWLGFIFADGYIYSAPLYKKEGRIDYNFELCTSGKDYEHMCKFAKFINYTKELKLTKADKNGHTRCRICLSSKHLWNTLNDYGCTPNKSLTLAFPKENIFTDKNLIKHFIRGYIDGDGWISYNDKEHNHMDLGLLGTEQFLIKIQEYLNTNNKLEHNHNNLNEPTMKLSYSGSKGYIILKYLYDNSTIYLQRKYERYLEYCRLFE